jgi:hypothetical protein
MARFENAIPLKSEVLFRGKKKRGSGERNVKPFSPQCLLLPETVGYTRKEIRCGGRVSNAGDERH